jgi:hypothetical protein
VAESIDEAAMQRELADLLTLVRNGQVDPSDFTARLEALHARFLGDDANAPEIVERRRAASAAYDELTAGTDRHHQLELLAKALGVDLAPPSAPT